MKGYMGSDSFKSFVKTVRRSQNHFKYSLLFLLLIIAAAAVGYQLSRKLSLPSVSDDIKIGQLTDVSSTPTPFATPTPSPLTQAKPSSTPVVNQATQVNPTRMQMSSRVSARNQRVQTKRVQSKIMTKNSSTYVVKKGDSLWKISVKKYNTGHQWTRIYSANRKVIGANPRLIHPNTRLVIPHR
jgi:nucleoid-associated protein YgaU